MRKASELLLILTIATLWLLIVIAVIYTFADFFIITFLKIVSLKFPLNIYLLFGLLVSVYFMYDLAREPFVLAYKNENFGGIIAGTVMFLALSILIVPLITIGYPLFLSFLKKGDLTRAA